MASDLISRKALVKAILAERDKIPLTIPAASYEFVREKENSHGNAMRGGIRKALHCVETAPAVDAVEVVRCRECKYRDNVDECPMTYYEYIWDNRSGGLDEDKANKTEDDGFCHKGVKKDAVD